MAEATQALPGQLVDIGTVAAQNIAQAINAHPDTVPAIKKAIADEINALGSHFTLAFADIQTQYEIDLGKIKSVFSFAKANGGKLVGAGVVVFLLGVLVGYVV